MMEREIEVKNQRLRKFNQLNEDGTLRGVNPCYVDPSLCEEKVDGTEEWQK
jgi:hypothetical protein